MISFYEFDRLLRKANKPQNEALFGGSRKRAQDLAGKIGGLPASNITDDELSGMQEPDTAAPAASGPSLPPPTQQATGAPLPDPVASPKAPRGRRGRLATRAKQGVGGNEKPSIINQERDPYDPASPKMQALRAGEEVDGLKGFGTRRVRSASMADTSATDRASVQSAKIQKNLDMFNNMAGGRVEKSRVGEPRRISDWAATIAWVLEKKFGVKQLTDAQSGEPIPFGSPFQIVFQPGSGGKDGLPEVLFNDPQKFGQFVRTFWNTIGSGHRKNGGENEGKYANVLGSMLGQYQQARQSGDNHTVQVVEAAVNMFKLLNNRNIAGASYRLGELADKLTQLRSSMHKHQSMDAQKSGGEAPEPIHNDPHTNMEALMMLVQNARKTGYEFLKSQGSDIGPQTMLTVVPLHAGRVGDDELRGSTAAGTTNPSSGEHRTASDMAKQWADDMDRHDPELDGLGEPDHLESKQWSDLCDIMEHWGF